MSAAVGMANSLWWRARWILIASAAYLLFLGVGVRCFPQYAEVFISGAMVLIFVWAALLNVFAFGPADIGSQRSTFPAHMLVLPVRTRALVGWPMLYAVATSAALWLGVVVAIIVPIAAMATEWPEMHSAPARVWMCYLIWPALVLGSATVWVQAVAWSPFPTPWIRAPLLIAAVIPVGWLAMWGCVNNDDALKFNSAIALEIAWTAVAYVVGVLGLARARCGGQSDWRRLLRAVARYLPRRTTARPMRVKPYRSAGAAQYWHDFRRNAVSLPFLVSLSSLCFVPILISMLFQRDQPHGLQIHSVLIKSEVIGLGAAIFLPLVMAGVAATALGKFDFWGSERMSTFFAVRPMACSEFVWAKFKAAALGAATAWGLLLCLLLIWAGLDISPLNRHESLVKATWNYATSKDIAAFGLCAVAYLFLLWRALVTGCWIALAGRKWLSTAMAVLPLTAFAILPAAAEWIYTHPLLRDQFVKLLPWIVAGVVAIKLCTAACVAARLMQLGIVPIRFLVATLLLWAALLAGIVGVLAWYVTLTPLIVCAVALLVPLVRIAAAPLALHYNRHR
ncbi:MAG TPA: hypothetical protein VFE46_06015 [Pirellulales bacterium]|jgi:hypothetical protein|nr:hypothetical protein [Pirellulales bacterium]